jgi:hypothetical protein
MKPHWVPPGVERSATEFTAVPAKNYIDMASADPVFRAIKSVLPAGSYIAGGYVLGLVGGFPANDVDIWFKDLETYLAAKTRVASLLSELPEKLFVKSKTTHHATQLIISQQGRKHLPVSLDGRYLFNNAGDLLDTFDFTVTQLALEGEQLWVGPMTLRDIQERKLTLLRRKTCYVDLRVDKYIKKGFTLTEESRKILSEESPNTLHKLYADIQRQHAAETTSK